MLSYVYTLVFFVLDTCTDTQTLCDTLRTHIHTTRKQQRQTASFVHLLFNTRTVSSFVFTVSLDKETRVCADSNVVDFEDVMQKWVLRFHRISRRNTFSCR